jgi:hypothetical protein
MYRGVMLDANQKEALLRRRLPKLTDAQIQDLRAFLDDYCDFLPRVYERFERDGLLDFDRPPEGS